MLFVSPVHCIFQFLLFTRLIVSNEKNSNGKTPHSKEQLLEASNVKRFIKVDLAFKKYISLLKDWSGHTMEAIEW